MGNAIQVWILYKAWGDDTEKNRRAGNGILVTSRESSTIQMGDRTIKVSSPSLTIAGKTTKRATNEISFWLEELNSKDEYDALDLSYRGEQGCYLVFDGTQEEMKNKRFLTNAEYTASATEYQLAFAQ